MRPTRLTMQAFGPYATRQELALDDLGETGIYAITGETGAGKTTIFDAIVFALYGSGSGEDRSDGRSMRSAAASPELETSVELEFVSGGKNYAITRKPEQFIVGKRSGEPVKKPAFQVLTMPDGAKLTRAREIDERIERDILGVTKEQFCQIVMIAQGEFRRLLRADTRERTRILRKIFRTERFDALSRQMDRLCREKYRDLQSSRDQAAFCLRAIQLGPDAPLGASLEALRCVDPGALVFEEAVDLARRIAEADAADFTAAHECLEQAAQGRELAKSAYERACAQAEKRRALEGLLRDGALEKGELDRARQALSEAEASRGEIERLGNVIATESGALPRYDQLEQLVDGRDRLKADREAQERVRRDAEARVQDLQARFASLQDEQERIKDAAGRLLEAEKKLNELRNEGNKLNLLSARIEALAEARERSRLAGEAATRAEEGAKTASQSIETLSCELESLGNTELTLSQLETGAGELERRAVELRRLGTLLRQWEAALSEYNGAQESFERKGEAARALRHEAVQARARYNANLAGIWALELVDGVPCPVCGSVHHPNRAKLTQNTVTRDDVEKAEAAAADAEQAFNAQALSCSEGKLKLESLERQIADMLPETPQAEWSAELNRRAVENARADSELAEALRLAREARDRSRALREALIPTARAEAERAATAEREARSEASAAQAAASAAEREAKTAAEGVMPENWTELDLSDAVALNREQVNAWQDRADQAERDQTRLGQLEREREETEAGLDAERRSIQDARERLSGLNAQIVEFDRRIATLAGELPHPTRKACQRSIDQNTRYRQTLEQVITDARSAVVEWEKQVAGTEGRIKALQEELEGLPPMDPVLLKAEFDAADAAWKQANDCERAAHTRKENNAVQVQSLLTQVEAARRLEGEYRVMKDVSDTANGDLTGQSKITLEAYVQTAYFDRIIAYANRRLIHMSRQRYDLVRQDAKDGGKQGKTGLELDVVDHANGTRRAVGTLSGGEGFLASLSLALGMSDAIQASAASAVQLDTMFVDEGFGSLSENFLELVMDELNDTASSGHRLIGVISHVDEIREGIDRRIEVAKSQDGVSTARIR